MCIRILLIRINVIVKVYFYNNINEFNSVISLILCKIVIQIFNNMISVEIPLEILVYEMSKHCSIFTNNLRLTCRDYFNSIDKMTLSEFDRYYLLYSINTSHVSKYNILQILFEFKHYDDYLVPIEYLNKDLYKQNITHHRLYYCVCYSTLKDLKIKNIYEKLYIILNIYTHNQSIPKEHRRKIKSSMRCVCLREHCKDFECLVTRDYATHLQPSLLSSMQNSSNTSNTPPSFYNSVISPPKINVCKFLTQVKFSRNKNSFEVVKINDDDSETKRFFHSLYVYLYEHAGIRLIYSMSTICTLCEAKDGLKAIFNYKDQVLQIKSHSNNDCEQCHSSQFIYCMQCNKCIKCTDNVHMMNDRLYSNNNKNDILYVKVGAPWSLQIDVSDERWIPFRKYIKTSKYTLSHNSQCKNQLCKKRGCVLFDCNIST